MPELQCWQTPIGGISCLRPLTVSLALTGVLAVGDHIPDAVFRIHEGNLIDSFVTSNTFVMQ